MNELERGAYSDLPRVASDLVPPNKSGVRVDFALNICELVIGLEWQRRVGAIDIILHPFPAVMIWITIETAKG